MKVFPHVEEAKNNTFCEFFWKMKKVTTTKSLERGNNAVV